MDNVDPNFIPSGNARTELIEEEERRGREGPTQPSGDGPSLDDAAPGLLRLCVAGFVIFIAAAIAIGKPDGSTAFQNVLSFLRHRGGPSREQTFPHPTSKINSKHNIDISVYQNDFGVNGSCGFNTVPGQFISSDPVSLSTGGTLHFTANGPVVIFAQPFSDTEYQDQAAWPTSEGSKDPVNEAERKNVDGIGVHFIPQGGELTLTEDFPEKVAILCRYADANGALIPNLKTIAAPEGGQELIENQLTVKWSELLFH